MPIFGNHHLVWISIWSQKTQKYRCDDGHALVNITIVRWCDIDIKECIDLILTIESGEDVFLPLVKSVRCGPG